MLKYFEVCFLEYSEIPIGPIFSLFECIVSFISFYSIGLGLVH